MRTLKWVSVCRSSDGTTPMRQVHLHTGHRRRFDHSHDCAGSVVNRVCRRKGQVLSRYSGAGERDHQRRSNGWHSTARPYRPAPRPRHSTAERRPRRHGRTARTFHEVTTVATPARRGASADDRPLRHRRPVRPRQHRLRLDGCHPPHHREPHPGRTREAMAGTRTPTHRADITARPRPLCTRSRSARWGRGPDGRSSTESPSIATTFVEKAMPDVAAARFVTSTCPTVGTESAVVGKHGRIRRWRHRVRGTAEIDPGPARRRPELRGFARPTIVRENGEKGFPFPHDR